jgi:mannitol 2-dehydrogenase
MTIELNNLSLYKLPKSVHVPRYNRANLSAGIIHIGVGNFHRAHQATYMHQLFQMGESLDWAIYGAGIMSSDENMRNNLVNQDWLSTIIELSDNKIEAQVCGSMIGFVDINAPKLIEEMAAPNIRIVSLTITEGGYFINQDSGEFDLSNKDIESDIKSIDTPKTVFGILLSALKLRKDRGVKAFTIMSCDNIPHNGNVTKKAVLGLANAIDRDLAAWISHNVTFPNSMVDCIAPQVSSAQKLRLEQLFDIKDNAPVVCESFRQWVLEDNFANGRPALEKVGVQFVPDVAPYELMKLRVLNGSHAALAYPAGLMGIEFVHEAMQNKLITDYLHRLVIDEVIPSLPEVPGINANNYFEVINQRFSNSEIKDTVERLYQDGQNRLPKFVLPTIIDNIDNSRSISGLSLVIALWCKLLQCAAIKGNGIHLLDSNHQAHFKKAQLANANPDIFMQMTGVFGELSQSSLFTVSFTNHLEKLNTIGVEATLKAYVEH